MPELPEVESVAGALRDTLLGRRLTRMDVHYAGILEPSAAAMRRAMVGRELRGVHRHGKYMILAFGEIDPACVMIHLRMTGQIFVSPDYIPDAHVHLTLDFDGQPVYYRDVRKFGRWTLVDHPQHPSAIAHVGPDMMKVRFREWDARCAHRTAPWKSVLLDQGVAAGVGNIYADEALFVAGIHPRDCPAQTSAEKRKAVWKACKQVMRLAINHGGTTFLDYRGFTGQPGNFRRKLRVFQRNGQPCRDCGIELERITVAGRSTHYCPRCQARK